VLEVLNHFTGHQATREENQAGLADPTLVCGLEESRNTFSVCLMKTSELEAGDTFALAHLYSICKNRVMLKLLTPPTFQPVLAFCFSVCKNTEIYVTINSK